MTLPSNLVVRQSCGCPSEAVREAAFVPERESSDLEPAAIRLRATAERGQCLAEMAAAGGDQRDIKSWMESVLDALLLDLEQHNLHSAGRIRFLQKFDDTLNQAMLAGQNLNRWNGVISVLRRRVLPGLVPEERAALEVLFGQARVVISEAEQRARSYWQWQAERQAENLRETNRALLTTFNIHQLGDVLYEHLPGLGIPSAYLVLYETTADPLGFSRLMMAYTEQGRAAIEPAGWRFPTRQIVPPEFLPPRAPLQPGRRAALLPGKVVGLCRL